MGDTRQSADTVVTSDMVYHRQKWPWGWLVLIAVGITLNILLVALSFDHHPHKTSSIAGIEQSMHQPVTAQEQLDAAVASARTALRHATTASQRAEAYKDLGMAYVNEHRYPNAISAYTTAIATDGSVTPEVLDSLAYTYAVSGQRDQAIALYQELLTTVEQQPTAGHEALNDQESSAVQAYQQDIQNLQQGGTL